MIKNVWLVDIAKIIKAGKILHLECVWSDDDTTTKMSDFDSDEPFDLSKIVATINYLIDQGRTIFEVVLYDELIPDHGHYWSTGMIMLEEEINEFDFLYFPWEEEKI